MDEISARSNIYGLFSRVLLQELDTETLEFLKSDATVLEFFPNWKQWENRLSIPDTQLLEEYLNPDFVNLSILHLIPYETFYTRPDQMIETGGANPATDMYSAYDFVVDFEKARVVSPDHIGIELEFMHHLCEAERKALESEDADAAAELRQVQLEFLKKHLVKWAPLYLINMKFEARTPLYYDAAEAALEFILSDHETLVQKVAQNG